MSLIDCGIPYSKFAIEKDGLVYSCDKIRVAFYLHPSGFSYKSFKAFMENYTFPDSRYRLQFKEGNLRNVHNKAFWSFGGVVLTFFQDFKQLGYQRSGYIVGSVILEFNPNKHLDNPLLSYILGGLDPVNYKDGQSVSYHITRCDLALDIPYHMDDIRILTRKERSAYCGTFYFGKRGQNGYTRVYDKRKELLEKSKIDIGIDVTREEFEWRGDRFLFDNPFKVGDCGRYEMLKYVPLDLFPKALQTLDPKTQKKLKTSCFEYIPFNQQIFYDVRKSVLDHLGFYRWNNMDDENVTIINDEEDYEIESDIREFRKFIGDFE